MAKTSLTESNASDYLSKKRYPRPLLVRALRWVLIKWWILPVIGLTIYLLLASFSQVLLNQLFFLMQHWWAILLSIFGLIVVGIAIRVSYQRAYDDAINEEREPERRMHAEAEREGYPPGFTLRRPLQGREEIFQIAWSPDGRKLAAGSYGIIRLWNADSGAELRTLQGHTAPVTSVAWSPDGRRLASGSDDRTIRLWDTDSGAKLRTLTAHTSNVNSVAWSPDGRTLASGSWDNTVRLWNADSGAELRTLTAHADLVISVAWSPDGLTLASGSGDRTIRLWDADSGAELRTLQGHTDWVRSVAWSPDGRRLASGSDDRTIRLWDADSGQQRRILEEHTSNILSLSFSVDGRFLASKSMDGTVRLWRTDDWEVVAVLKEYYGQYAIYRLAFHPKEATTLATFGDESRAIRIWDLDVYTLLGKRLDTSTVSYVNAKVVLVGNSGVGKSGLALVLSGCRFAPTESTHGRKVWEFESREVELDSRHKEKRETLLWDLAGQPDYRLIHQLHLSEVALALVIFDSHSENDPFAGVRHWVRALQLAGRVQKKAALHMKKFLVAARVDRGGKSVSRERIDALVKELGFDGYFETSAKEGQNIASLAEAVRNGIEWDMLPKVTSTELFQRIQAFLVEEKKDGRQLSTFNDLYRTFLRSEKTESETQDLPAQFDTCVRRIQSQGLIQRLSFGNLVLLQPELLDAYAAALVNAVRNEPDGLGNILEDKVRACDFPMPEDERLTDREQEKLLLVAMVEDLLRYEIALREQGEDGQYLVFPALSTRENPDLPDPEGKAVVFGFEGPVQNIYAALAVRLSHSGEFKKKDLWKDVMTFAARAGGMCGIFVRNSGEGRGELMLFFDKAAGEETRFYFEDYVYRHLQRHAESISRRRIFVCSGCGFEVTDQLVKLRSERGFNWLDCPACGTRVSMLDREERLSENLLSVVQSMDRAADEQRKRAIATSVIQGKITTGDFDVFLCHNSKDKPEVKRIGEQLKEHRAIRPWLDEWELRPGLPWQRLLEEQIEHIKSAAVFVGKDGVGPWQQVELETFLREFVTRGCPVIPVVLADAPEKPQLPVFLRGMTWVDFRLQDPDPMERLVWGVTGEHSPTA